MDQPTTQQRIRITFAKDGALRFVGHLDLAKTWERVLRRAQIPLEYTQGFNPRPRLQFAAALPVGVSSETEYLDVWMMAHLEGDFPSRWIIRLNEASPAGLRTLALDEVAVSSPSLPPLVTYAEYVVRFETESLEAADLRARVSTLLAATTLIRPGHKKPYDLRTRILDLSVSDDGTLHARLSANERANARPDEVLAALGLDATRARIHRRHLQLQTGADQKGGTG